MPPNDDEGEEFVGICEDDGFLQWVREALTFENVAVRENEDHNGNDYPRNAAIRMKVNGNERLRPATDFGAKIRLVVKVRGISLEHNNRMIILQSGTSGSKRDYDVTQMLKKCKRLAQLLLESGKVDEGVVMWFQNEMAREQEVEEESEKSGLNKESERQSEQQIEYHSSENGEFPEFEDSKGGENSERLSEGERDNVDREEQNNNESPDDESDNDGNKSNNDDHKPNNDSDDDFRGHPNPGKEANLKGEPNSGKEAKSEPKTSREEHGEPKSSREDQGEPKTSREDQGEPNSGKLEKKISFANTSREDKTQLLKLAAGMRAHTRDKLDNISAYSKTQENLRQTN
jgi:hypothetical protein